MSVGASRDLEELFRLNIAFDTANDITIETKTSSDRARGIRQVRTVTRWKNTTRLGRGSSGQVSLQVQEGAPENCRAVKEIVKGTDTAPLQVNHRRELLALGRLSRRDDVFVQFFGWYEDSWTVYLVMEYFEHGDLSRHLSNPLAESDAQVVSKQLLEGLAVLHGQNWAHRDLKPANVFVVEKSPWWVKIGDFGISKRIRSGNTRFQTMIGTREFLAPEVLNIVSEGSEDISSDEEDEYTVAVDMWSLGCVIYQILTLEVPFANPRKLKSYCRSKVEKFPVAPLRRHDVSAAATRFLKELLEPYPSARISADAALVRAWVQEAQELPVNQLRSLRASVNADIGLSMETGQEDGVKIDEENGINADQEHSAEACSERSVETDQKDGVKNDEETGINACRECAERRVKTGQDVEIFKRFPISMADPCYRVLPAALNKYNIKDDWRKYALYISYDNKEHCLGLEEKPLILFKTLARQGLKPVFMLRKHAAPMNGFIADTVQSPGEDILSPEAEQEQHRTAASPDKATPSHQVEQNPASAPDLNNWF